MGASLQIRSRSIISYYKRDPKKKHAKSIYQSIERQRSIENFVKQETYTGMVTVGAQHRLTKAIEIMLQIVKQKFFTSKGKTYPFKINFVTLTLYSFNKKIPARDAHKTCLRPLLRWLSEQYGMSCYIWKAELQMKRKDCKQLHYHLTTDVYIPYLELRNKWNELQRKAGYLDSHFEKHGHWNPNSTDIHAVYKVKNLIGYMKKAMVRYSDKKKYQLLRSNYLVKAELTKANQNQETIEGKVWDCSQNIKTSYFEIMDFGDITHRIAQGVRNGEIRKKEFERCTVYELTRTSRDAASYLGYPHKVFYDDYIEKTRNFQRFKPDINVFSSS